MELNLNMNKLFEKHETLFCVLLIVIYVVLNSYCIQNFGVVDYRSTIINTVYNANMLCYSFGLFICNNFL